MEGRKNCYHCKHGEYHRGFLGNMYEPPEDEYTECLIENVDFELMEKLDYNEEKLPLVCGHYEPKWVDKCHYCNEEMNVAEHDVHFFFEGEAPLCSKECQEKLYIEYDAQFKDEII